MQAAVLRVKLPYLDDWNQARRQHARLYNQFLADRGLFLPVEAAACESVYHIYLVRTQNRDQLQGHLSEQGIAAGIHYPVPVHLQPAFAHLGYQPGSYPVTEKYAGQILSLPMYPELTLTMIDHVAGSILTFVSERATEGR